MTEVVDLLQGPVKAFKHRAVVGPAHPGRGGDDVKVYLRKWEQRQGKQPVNEWLFENPQNQQK